MIPYPQGSPERAAYLHGAADEARLREAPRSALPTTVRELLNYLDALAKHQPEEVQTPGAVLTRATRIFVSTLTREDRRAIRRALRDKP